MVELTDRQKKVLKRWAAGKYATDGFRQEEGEYNETDDRYYYRKLDICRKGNLLDRMPCQVWDDVVHYGEDWDCQAIELYLDDLAKEMKGGEQKWTKR